MAKLINLEGQRFGRLLVLCRAKNRGKKTRYLIKCDCGQEKEMTAYTITTHKGCGCIRLERCKQGIRQRETDLVILNNRANKKKKQDRDNWLRRKANTSLKEFETKKKKQKGLCAICFIRSATHADHDHITGKARDILCRQCNTGLGLFYDNIGTLASAIRYLEKHIGEFF
jgi:hypothetical protein